MDFSKGSSKSKRRSVIKWIIYTLLLFVFYGLQTAPGFFRFLDAQPLLTIPLVLSIAMFEHEIGGAVFGILAGFLWDMQQDTLFWLQRLSDDVLLRVGKPTDYVPDAYHSAQQLVLQLLGAGHSVWVVLPVLLRPLGYPRYELGVGQLFAAPNGTDLAGQHPHLLFGAADFLEIQRIAAKLKKEF